MKKKELRKELELTLIKAIEEPLNKRNAEAARKIREITFGAAKIIAKKFYKSVKPKAPKAVVPPVSKPVAAPKSAVKAKTPLKTKSKK